MARSGVPQKDTNMTGVNGCPGPVDFPGRVQLHKEPLMKRVPSRLDTDEQRHLEPLPIAVDVIEPDLAQPLQLGMHVE